MGSHPGDLLSSLYLTTRKNDVCLTDLLDCRLVLPDAEPLEKSTACSALQFSAWSPTHHAGQQRGVPVMSQQLGSKHVNILMLIICMLSSPFLPSNAHGHMDDDLVFVSCSFFSATCSTYLQKLYFRPQLARKVTFSCNGTSKLVNVSYWQTCFVHVNMIDIFRDMTNVPLTFCISAQLFFHSRFECSSDTTLLFRA